jgi:hypothetical protein
MANSNTTATMGGPEPGDVVFVYTRSWESVKSCIAQRLFDKGFLPCFTHVAVVLSDRFVIEASTGPASTWSGGVLGTGVRLKLVPDLIFGASRYRVLRHPNAKESANNFRIDEPRILQVIGSGYSTESLVAAARAKCKVVGPAIPPRRLQVDCRSGRDRPCITGRLQIPCRDCATFAQRHVASIDGEFLLFAASVSIALTGRLVE